jgi:ketosteroid isomerase-like protein
LVRAPAAEQGQAVEEESEKAEVDRTFRSYADALSRGDLSGIVKYCSNPLVVVSQHDVTVLPTAAEIETFYGTISHDLKEQGYSYSTLLEIHVRLLGTSVALVSDVVTEYKTDGSALMTLGGTFILRKTDEVWKLVVLTFHPPKYVIRAD